MNGFLETIVSPLHRSKFCVSWLLRVLFNRIHDQSRRKLFNIDYDAARKENGCGLTTF